MVGFYRKFCSNFSTVAAPLTDMTSAKRTFRWTSDCEAAFHRLKSLMMSEPVLRTPDYSLPFTLHIDASSVGVGAALLQKDSTTDILHPVSDFSAKLKKHQMAYSTVEKECLSLVLALQKFQCYLPQGAPITVYTDHNPLTFLRRMQHSNLRILRWALQIQPYHLVVKHIKGVNNVLADTLSRDLPLTSSD